MRSWMWNSFAFVLFCFVDTWNQHGLIFFFSFLFLVLFLVHWKLKTNKISIYLNHAIMLITLCLPLLCHASRPCLSECDSLNWQYSHLKRCCMNETHKAEKCHFVPAHALLKQKGISHVSLGWLSQRLFSRNSWATGEHSLKAGLTARWCLFLSQNRYLMRDLFNAKFLFFLNIIFGWSLSTVVNEV